MKRRWILFAVCAAALGAETLYGQAAGKGTITGRAVDSKGAGIGNAQVSVSITATAPEIVQPHTAATQTAADGTFSFAGLPPGSYMVCAGAESNQLLNSCRWGTPSATAVAQAGNTTALAPIVLQRGHPLQVRIDDPQELLRAHEGVTAGARLLVGIWSNTGLFIPLPVRASGNKGRDHELYIPEDVDLHLSVFSGFFAMGDGNGVAVQKTPQGKPTQSFPVKVTSKDGPKSFTFRVIGKQ